MACAAGLVITNLAQTIRYNLDNQTSSLSDQKPRLCFRQRPSDNIYCECERCYVSCSHWELDAVMEKSETINWHLSQTTSSSSPTAASKHFLPLPSASGAYYDFDLIYQTAPLWAANRTKQDILPTCDTNTVWYVVKRTVALWYILLNPP